MSVEAPSDSNSKENNAGSICFDPIMSDDALQGLAKCCRHTVRSHVVHNPMMLCPDCKLMIKCFADEKSFSNYVTFCRTKGRRIKTEIDHGFYFVMYNSYAGPGS
jgi:hypothetical protein